MRIAQCLLFLALVSAPASVSAGKSAAPQPKLAFHEQCEGPAVSHPQAKWRCMDRGYASVEQMQHDLLRRFPLGAWNAKRWDDPALTRLRNVPVWWDCASDEVQMCAIWARMAPGQFIILQQVLDHERGNQWLGVGISTYCEGTKAQCNKLAATAAAALDPAVDFSEIGSMIGAPPIVFE